MGQEKAQQSPYISSQPLIVTCQHAKAPDMQVQNKSFLFKKY